MNSNADKFNMPRVAIIIPVYNAEATIERTLDSVFEQTYKNYEIFVIDDGSTDRTKEILEKYEAEYSNINVFIKQNGGVGSARNLGLKNVNDHEWIAFIDADDFVDSDYIEKMMGYDADIVISGFVCHHGSKIARIDKPQKQMITVDELRKSYFESFGLAVVYYKLYRRTVIENTLFDENLKTGEDGIFNLDIFNNINSVQYVDYCGYHICMREDSLTHSIHNEYTPMLDIEWQKWWGERCYKARQNAGIQEQKSGNIRSNSVYRFQMLENLFKNNVPYSKKEKKRRIKEILEDGAYRENIFMADIIESKKTHILMKTFMIINSTNLVYVFFLCLKKIHK